MTTIVNNPPSNNSGGLLGLIVVLLFLAVFGYLVYFYGLPALRNTQSPQINIPSKVDINVNQAK